MKELVVISGKGGTGKTSLVAALASLWQDRVVLADCDVDAADLHLVLDPRIERSEAFIGGSKARIDSNLCTACGTCASLCRFDAINFDGPGHGHVARTFRVDSLACEGCGVCVRFCNDHAIQFSPAVCGQWFISSTRCGPLVHARMEAGAENSGKLVTVIRQQAQRIAEQQRCDAILCDGSPGIGCPVIASLTGASLALIVVEPTASGLHDFRRVAQLARQLNVPASLVVNKADLNYQVAAQLHQAAASLEVTSLGDVPYDPAVTRAQITHQTVVEASNGPAAMAIRRVSARLYDAVESSIAARAGRLFQLQQL